MIRKKKSATKPVLNTVKTPELKETKYEEKATWSIWAVIKNIIKGFLLLMFVPAFLNYAALIREDKELKPEGHFIVFSKIGMGRNGSLLNSKIGKKELLCLTSINTIQYL